MKYGPWAPLIITIIIKIRIIIIIKIIIIKIIIK